MSNSNQSESFPGRNFYRGKGVSWARFLPLYLLALLLAALLAAGMFGLFVAGQYYVVILPAIAGLLAALLVKLAVAKGHCRSAFVASTAGIVAGLVLYLGYFYCGMIYHLGTAAALHPEALPYYIRARMNTDVIQDVHRPNDGEQTPHRPRGDSWFNWGTFGIEFVAVMAFTTLAGFQRARKPYCNACQKWMSREATYFDPQQSTELLEALRLGSARSLAAVCAAPVFSTVPNTTLAAEVCPTAKEGGSRDCPVYVSLKHVSATGGGSPVSDPFDSAKGKVVLRSLQLNADEIAALGLRIKVLESIAGRTAVAAFKPGEPRETSDERSGALAEITPVEPDFAGRVLTKRNAIIGTAYSFAALLLLFAGVGLAAFGGITAFPDKQSNQVVSPGKKFAGMAILSVGGILFLGTAIFFLANPTYFGNRFLLKVVKREFGRRAKRLVESEDPDALFVEIVPKLTWGKLGLENAREIGYLRVDESKRQILFEGDRERWRIPAAAITSCGVEFFVEGQGTHAAMKIFYVVLRVRHATEFWEAPIRERGGAGKFRSGQRQRSANRLYEAIHRIQGAER